MNAALFRFFVREYRYRRRRSALITFAIGWSSFVLIVLLAFGAGLAQQVQTALFGLGRRLIMVYPGQTSKPYRGLPEGRPIRFHIEDVQLLAARVPQIALISPENDTRVEVSHGDRHLNRLVTGVFASFGHMRAQDPQPGGRFLNDLDLRYRRRVAFLGWKVARDLFGDANPVGQWIRIQGVPFRVIGVLRPKLQSGMYGGPDAAKVVIPFTTYVAMFGTTTVERIHVRPVDAHHAEAVRQAIRAVLAQKYRFDPDDPDAVDFWDLIESERIQARIMLGLQIFLGIMGVITLGIAGVGVMNIMYATVHARVPEFGLKMALGMRRRAILLQVLGETAWIFARGAVWGILTAWNLVHLVRQIPIPEESWSIQGYLARPIFSGTIALVYVAILAGIVLFAGIFPAMRAARLQPVEALRTE